MQNMGLGGVTLDNNSQMANRLEGRAFAVEDRASQEASAIPTGLGAIPGIAKSMAKPVGEAIAMADNLQSAETLTQVMNEATQTGLLKPEEAKTLSLQLSTPEGKAIVKSTLAKVLPARRVDQKAVEWLTPRINTTSQLLANELSNAPEADRDAVKNRILSEAIDKIALESASMPIKEQQAIMSRFKTAMGISPTGGSFAEKAALITLRADEQIRVEDAKHRNASARDEAKNVANAKLWKDRAYDADIRQATSTLEKDAAWTATLKDNIEELNRYDGNYIGFTTKYLSNIGRLTADTTSATDHETAAERDIAYTQQRALMRLLNTYMHEMSGAAVTTSEGKRLLAAFGLVNEAGTIIPNKEDLDLDRMSTNMARELVSNLKPQMVIDGIKALANDLREKHRITNEIWAARFSDDPKFVAKVNNIYSKVAIPDLIDSKLGAVNVDPTQIGQAIGVAGTKTLSGLADVAKGTTHVTKEAFQGTTQTEDEPYQPVLAQ